MTVHISWWEMIGDGKIQVFARTEAGNDIDVITGHDKLGTPDLTVLIHARAKQADQAASALATRAGRAEGDTWSR